MLFRSYAIERLRSDKEEVLTTAQEIVATSRANMNNQQRVHAAVLRLLEAKNFDDFIHCITMDLATILDVDIAVMVVESNGHDIPHVQTSGIRVIPGGTVDKWMEGKNVLLQDNISGIEAIYGGGAALKKEIGRWTLTATALIRANLKFAAEARLNEGLGYPGTEDDMLLLRLDFSF